MTQHLRVRRNIARGAHDEAAPIRATRALVAG